MLTDALFVSTQSGADLSQAIEGSFRTVVGIVWLPLILWMLVMLVWDVKPPRSAAGAYIRSILIALAVSIVVLFLGLSMADGAWGGAILGIAILASVILFVSVAIAAALVVLWIMRPGTQPAHH